MNNRNTAFLYSCIVMKKFFFMLTMLFLFTTVAFGFGKNSVQYEPIEWKSVKTVHFDITFPAGLEKEAFRAAVTAEESYQYLANSLNHRLTRAIPIILYPSRTSFKNSTLFPFSISERAGAFTILLNKRIAIPLTGSESGFRELLTHELVHAFQFDIIFSDTSGRRMPLFMFFKVPSWIMEGMAEYLSEGFDSSADLYMKDLIISEEYADMEELTALKVKSRYMIYKEGQAFFYFLELRYGREIMGRLLRDIRDLRSFEKAVKANTGKSSGELNSEWLRFYKRRYLPLIEKRNYADEEGKRLAFIRGSVAPSPAVSPDGKKVACFTERGLYTNLVIRDINGGNKSRTRVLAGEQRRFRFESFSPGFNTISWSGDGSLIAFRAHAVGNENIYLIDPDRGSVKERIRLPFSLVLFPRLSRDGNLLVFIGVTGNTGNVFVYDRTGKRIDQITDDRFTYRDPLFTRNNESVIVSTNRNEAGDAGSGNFNIAKISLQTGKITWLVHDKGRNMHPDLSEDGTRLLFTSNRSGIYNVWVLNMETGDLERVTNSHSALFHPRWIPKTEKILFTAYREQGFDIYVKDEISGKYPDQDLNITYKIPAYHGTYTDPASYVFTPYRPVFTPDFIMVGASGTLSAGITGSLQGSFSDFTGSHRITLVTNYSFINDRHDYNIDLSYRFLRLRTDFTVGGYRLGTDLWELSLDSYLGPFHSDDRLNSETGHYGGYAAVQYPFNRFLGAELRIDGGLYEKDYPLDSFRKDISKNLYTADISLIIDTVKMRQMIPGAGTRFRVSWRQSVNFSGRDLSYSRFFADARAYGSIKNKYIFAFRGTGGAVAGADAGHMKFRLGGYNTLRGYGMNRFEGKYMFLFSGEFRFTFIENLRFGFPLYVGPGSIGGVLFVDAGSAWDGRFILNNSRTGTFHDLKFDFGCGLRFVIDPVMILKLDFAWPCSTTAVGPVQTHLGLGYEF